MLHEAHDENRLERLRERMASEGVQSNPVIASSCEDGFLVLDGAHRVRALKDLGCELALIQQVELPERTESWQHLLNGSGFDAGRLEGAVVVSGEPDEGFLAEVESFGGERVSLKPESSDLASEVDLLWKLHALYAEGSGVTRVEPGESVSLSEDEMIVRYRAFSAPELVEIVARGEVLPAGITRFRVRRRILGVRLPLAFLKEGDAGAAVSGLRDLVEERHRENRIRRYDEPVVLFE